MHEFEPNLKPKANAKSQSPYLPRIKTALFQNLCGLAPLRDQNFRGAKVCP